ncbi:MAG: hypothetical protein IT372_13800, partial [Polyangiaceae bacterium]|nr:hypothetical protein [Polyangiaceae bacterium]
GVESGRGEQRPTSAENENAYHFSDHGYGSAALMKSSPAPAGAPAKKPKAITRDFVAK